MSKMVKGEVVSDAEAVKKVCIVKLGIILIESSPVFGKPLRVRCF